MPLIRECLYEEKTQHGTKRYRFIRSRGAPKIGIKGKPGEPIFEECYLSLLNGGDKDYVSSRSVKARRSQHKIGTYSDLVQQYLCYMDHEQELGKIAEGTRKTYSNILLRTSKAVGPASVQSITEVEVLQILETLTTSAATYNNMLKAMRRMFKFAKRRAQLIAINPTDEIEPIEYNTDGFEEWTPEQIRQFLDHHPIGTKAHLAMTLFVFTACRRSDLVKLGRENLKKDGDDQFLEFVQTKGDRKNRKPVMVPVPDYLSHVLANTPTGEHTFLVTDYGQPFSSAGFGNRMRKWIDASDLPKNISSHGVRKTVGIMLAEADCSEYQIMAIHGHSSAKVSEIYTRKAKRRKLAKQGYDKVNLSAKFGLDG